MTGSVPRWLPPLGLLPGLMLGWLVWKDYPSSLIGLDHQIVVRDFVNIWVGGRLATVGDLRTLFDPIAYADHVRTLFGARLDMYTWGYPPHLLLLAVPLSHLPLVPAFLLWIVGTGAVFFFVLRQIGLSPWQAVAVAASPAILDNALIGQNGALLSGAALVGGLFLAERRPILAGLLLSLLTLKPQLGLLVPIYLLARGQWRPMVWAAGFGAALCTMSLFIFGVDAWIAYATVTAPFMRGFLEAPFGLSAHYMMIPPFVLMRALGVATTHAYAIQILVGLVSAALVWHAARRSGESRMALCLTLCLVPLTTPYAHSYDLVCTAVACALLITRTVQSATAARAVIALAWVFPGIALLLAHRILPGLGSLVLIGLGVVAWRRLPRTDAALFARPTSLLCPDTAKFGG